MYFKGDLLLDFTKPVQLLDMVKLTNSWYCTGDLYEAVTKS